MFLMNTHLGLIVEHQDPEGCCFIDLCSKLLKQRLQLIGPLLMVPIPNKLLALSGYYLLQIKVEIKVLNSDQEIVKLAEEISRYLVVHPSAADTLEGIANWWLKSIRFDESKGRVTQALDYLKKNGEVSQKKLTNGTIIYSKTRK